MYFSFLFLLNNKSGYIKNHDLQKKKIIRFYYLPLRPQVDRVEDCDIPPEFKTVIHVNYNTNFADSYTPS